MTTLYEKSIQNTVVALNHVHIFTEIVDCNMDAHEPLRFLLLQIRVQLFLICDELCYSLWVPGVVEAVLELLACVVLDVFAQNLVLTIHPYIWAENVVSVKTPSQFVLVDQRSNQRY